MEALEELYKNYKNQYGTLFQLYSMAQGYGYPVVTRISSFAKSSLFEHPDLTSIALLLVILYISFVFLVKAWRLTIGTILFSLKMSILALVVTCAVGVYNGVFNGDMSILESLLSTVKTLLRLVGDSVIGGDTHARA